MHWAIRFLATLLPIAYGLVGVAYVLVFFRDDPVARRLAPRALAGTVILHAAYIALLTLQFQRVPIATSFESLSALALALAVVYLVQEKRSGTPYTGILFVPLVFACQTVASAFITPSVAIQPIVKPILQSPLFGLHIAGALLGYSGFAVSAVFGLLYLMLYYELRAHRFGIVYDRLPSLEVLSGMNWRAAIFGLGCLTLAIAAGALMSLEVYPQFWQDPKVWLSLLTWVVYASCLLVRVLGGWRGTRIAYFTIAGFLLVVFSMLAANRLFPSFHDFRI
jgi:ABC-type transport system involved in cytochrome c biogenesis permease subunit